MQNSSETQNDAEDEAKRKPSRDDILAGVTDMPDGDLSPKTEPSPHEANLGPKSNDREAYYQMLRKIPADTWAKTPVLLYGKPMSTNAEAEPPDAAKNTKVKPWHKPVAYAGPATPLADLPQTRSMTNSEIAALPKIKLSQLPESDLATNNPKIVEPLLEPTKPENREPMKGLKWAIRFTRFLACVLMAMSFVMGFRTTRVFSQLDPAWFILFFFLSGGLWFCAKPLGRIQYFLITMFARIILSMRKKIIIGLRKAHTLFRNAASSIFLTMPDNVKPNTIPVSNWRSVLKANMKFQLPQIAAVVVLLVFAAFAWPTIYRYDHINIQGRVQPVRVHRITGKAEILYNSGWEIAESDSQATKLSDLPGDQIAKFQIMQAAANVNNKKFSCDFYNGSNWRIREIVVRLQVFNASNQQCLDRDYRMSNDYFSAPLTNCRFETYIEFGLGDGQRMEWSIKSAKGEPQ